MSGLDKDMLDAFWNTPFGSAPGVPEEHQVKQENIVIMSNMGRFFPLGTPCKALHGGFGVFGRYIGNSHKGSGMDGEGGKIWSIILVATPGGTIIETGRCYVNFELSEQELETLKYYEKCGNTESKTWYHEDSTQEELKELGEVMPWNDIKALSVDEVKEEEI